MIAVMDKSRILADQSDREIWSAQFYNVFWKNMLLRNMTSTYWKLRNIDDVIINVSM